MISNDLITKALSITWKTYEEFMEYHMSWPEFWWYRFCCYLLSKEFLEKYPEKYMSRNPYPAMSAIVWQCIYEYQSWNEKPIIDLLSKI